MQIPSLWKLLFSRWIRLFCLFQLSCLGLIILSRLELVAAFLASGGSLSDASYLLMALFCLYFPSALWLAVLLCAYITGQSLQKYHSVLACSGVSTHQLLCPLYLLAIFIALSNFYLVNTCAPQMRSEMHKILAQPILNPSHLTPSQTPFLWHKNYIYYNDKDTTALLKLGSWASDPTSLLYTSDTHMLTYALANETVFCESISEAYTSLTPLLSNVQRKNSIVLTDVLSLSELSQCKAPEYRLEWVRRCTHLLYPLIFMCIGCWCGLQNRYLLCASSAWITFIGLFLAKSLGPIYMFLPIPLLCVGSLLATKRRGVV